jgi:hypothetical protein
VSGTVATINVSEVMPFDQFDPKCLLVPNPTFAIRTLTRLFFTDF